MCAFDRSILVRRTCHVSSREKTHRPFSYFTKSIFASFGSRRRRFVITRPARPAVTVHPTVTVTDERDVTPHTTHVTDSYKGRHITLHNCTHAQAHADQHTMQHTSNTQLTSTDVRAVSSHINKWFERVELGSAWNGSHCRPCLKPMPDTQVLS